MHLDVELSKFVRSALLEWHDQNPRELPWKKTKDPYKIWISEIILQQTRVDQGERYYLEFIRRFPDIFSLAKAPLDEVLNAWQGLGYYTRARNLHETARFLVDCREGKFPEERDELLQLKGIGNYTAAAISSFAFGHPYAVVDGNVIRVLARFYGIQSDVSHSKTRKQIQYLADQILCRTSPDRYNQAIMDFGALMCKPRNPSCLNCPLADKCQAQLKNQTRKIPRKERKTKLKSRHFLFLLIQWKHQIVIERRNGKDIWPFLYQLPTLEGSSFTEAAVRKYLLQHIQCNPGDHRIVLDTQIYQQTLSHRKIYAQFAHFFMNNNDEQALKRGFKLVDIKNLGKFAFPKIIDCYLKDNLIYLKK